MITYEPNAILLRLPEKTYRKVKRHCTLNLMSMSSFANLAIELALKVKLHESVEAEKVRRDEKRRRSDGDNGI